LKEIDVIKLTKLNKKYKNRIITIVLWVFIGFLIVRGIGTLIKGNTINLKPFKNEITEKINETSKESEGVAFAENFISEYLNYTGNEKDYYKRLSQYTDMDFSNTKLKKMDVIYVNKVKSKWQNNKLLIVDIKVKVAEIPEMENLLDKYLTPSPNLIPSKKPVETIKPTSTPKKTVNKSPITQLSLIKKPRILLVANVNSPDPSEDNIDILYIRVPVILENNKYKISGYPTFISSPVNSEDSNSRELPGEGIKDDKEQKEIEKLITSFISCYYQGNETELEYFMKNKDKINCLNGEYEIVGIPAVEMKEFEGKYYARIYYQLTYKGNTFDNGMEFIITKENEKFLIEKYDTAIN